MSREKTDMARLDALANLLDNQFRIPGTNFRFGIDAIIGLVPYVGDISGLIISGYLFHIMLRNGAGVGVLLRMLGNVLLDAAVGVIPFIGDIFDFGYKANRRNVDLLKKYYAKNPDRPKVKHSLLILGFLFFLLVIGVMWLLWQAVSILTAWVFGLF